MSFKIGQVRRISRTEAANAKQSVLNSDSVHSTHAQVRVFVGNHVGWIPDQCLSCEAEYIAATAATSETKYMQALFLACGQHVNIHLRSDSSGAIGVASRRGL